MAPTRTTGDRRRVVAAALVGVLTIAACSSGDSPGANGADTAGESSLGGGATTVEDAASVPAGEWATADPAEVGLDEQALDRIADTAEATDSTCLSVVRDGTMAYRQTFGDTDPDEPAEVFSVTKSFASTLVGIAADDGDLDPGQPASDFLPDWAGTASADVTIEDLVQNDSGRFWSPASDYVQLVRASDRTRYAIDLDQADPPNTIWRYNNAAIQTLSEVIEAATGQRADDFGTERLLVPLGMANSSFTTDPAGNTLTFMGLHSTCDDLARFGLLFARNGRWGDEQLVSADWVRAATTPGDLNPAYGYLWWLQTDETFTGPLTDETTGHFPGAPADTFAAQGLGGQIVVVVPSEGLVITRMAAATTNNPTGDGFTDSLPAEVVAALSEPASTGD